MHIWGPARGDKLWNDNGCTAMFPCTCVAGNGAPTTDSTCRVRAYEWVGCSCDPQSTCSYMADSNDYEPCCGDDGGYCGTRTSHTTTLQETRPDRLFIKNRKSGLMFIEKIVCVVLTSAKSVNMPCFSLVLFLRFSEQAWNGRQPTLG